MDPDKAIEMADEILELIDDIGMEKEGSPAWEDFSEGVMATVTSIKEWVEENDHCTEAQVEALSNMMSGVSRWQR